MLSAHRRHAQGEPQGFHLDRGADRDQDARSNAAVCHGLCREWSADKCYNDVTAGAGTETKRSFSNFPWVDKRQTFCQDKLGTDRSVLLEGNIGNEERFCFPQAAELLNASATALQLLPLVADGPTALITEKADVATWAHLAQYFGLKLQAAVALQRFRVSSPPDTSHRDLAVNKLIECQAEW
eukprot:COSAG06_NODE_18412_length_889_cov_1.053165_2_plen_183_part_00